MNTRKKTSQTLMQKHIPKNGRSYGLTIRTANKIPKNLKYE